MATVNVQELGDIILGCDEHRVNSMVIERLAKDPTIYQANSLLCRIIGGKNGCRIADIRVAGLREHITRVAKFVSPDKHGNLLPKHVPDWCVSAIHARGEWAGIRQLSGLATCPVMRSDGSILLAPGYDAASGLYLDWPHPPLKIPNNPTIDDARRAMADLLEVVVDFPFQSPIHRSAWVSALLTLLARPAIAGSAPLFLVDANTRGSGKGRLCDSVSMIVTGVKMPTCSYSNNSEEMRKLITSALMRGEQVTLFDNISEIRSAELDRAITIDVWNDRVLGGNTIFSGPITTTFFATGNNVQLGGDMSRRVIHIRLESPLEKPESRDDFKHADLLGWLKENRFRLLASALTVLRAYVVAGRPGTGKKLIGSFENWCRWIRDAIVWTGQPDPAETRNAIHCSADTDAQAMAEFIRVIEMIDPNRNGWGTGEILSIADPKSGYPNPHSSEVVEMLSTAIVGLLGWRRNNAHNLGARLREMKGRNFGGLCIDIAGINRGNNRWLVRVAQESSSHPAKTDPPHPPHPPRNIKSESPKVVEVVDMVDTISTTRTTNANIPPEDRITI